MNPTLANRLTQHPAEAAEHLTPEVWAQANRLLLRKAIAEYAHELIVEPELLEPRDGGFALYQLASDDGSARYRFEAQRQALRHWHIEPASIRKWVGDTEQPLDALQFVIECRQRAARRCGRLPGHRDRHDRRPPGLRRQ